MTFVLAVARMRRMSFRDDLGLQWPTLGKALLWLAPFLALVLLQEFFWKATGLPQPQKWGDKYNSFVKATRVLGMVVLAPVFEETLFRGLLYHTIANTSLKEVGAISITSVAFAVLHFQSGFRFMPFVLANGVFYGIVRYSTGSTLMTILFHGLGNSYAAYQRLSR